MKTYIFICILSLFSLSTFAQTYSAADTSALNSLLASTGGGDIYNPDGWNLALPSNLRWTISNSPGQWYGLTWNTNTTKQDRLFPLPGFSNELVPLSY